MFIRALIFGFAVSISTACSFEEFELQDSSTTPVTCDIIDKERASVSAEALNEYKANVEMPSGRTFLDAERERAALLQRALKLMKTCASAGAINQRLIVLIINNRKNLTANGVLIEFVPHKRSGELGKYLIAFTREIRGSDVRIALFEDGSIEQLNVRSDLQNCIRQSLAHDHISLSLESFATEKERESLLSALQDLADDDCDIRETAVHLLESSGLKALPFVKLGCLSVDPECAMQCRALLRRLENIYRDNRKSIIHLRDELGLETTQSLLAIPRFPGVVMREDKVIIGEIEFSFTLLRERIPDVFQGLREGEGQ